MATPLGLAQQVFSALSAAGQGPQPAGCADATSVNATTSNGSNPVAAAFPTDLTSLLAFLFSFSALRDWLKLVVIGAVIESTRRLAFHLYYKAYNSFFITAVFDEDDSSYDWMMVWLSKQPSWAQARDVQISTRSFGLRSNAVMIEGEDDDPSSVVNGDRKLAYLPSISSTYSMWYKNRWVRISRFTRDGYYGRKEESLSVCILSWDHGILNQMLREAKKAYLSAQEHTISIYVSDSTNNWRHIASRPKRPLTSIVLDPGIKDLLIDDARDFLASKGWYSARGIPFRRGYLLYGAPGSGKTSIIHSLAGELGLDVYIISLSRVGLDDTALSELISELPEKCIALMEDIDAAFSQTLNRDADEQPAPDSNASSNSSSTPPPAPRGTSRISLSGLLNALDGVGAQEGRILFATTNKYASLDSALCRPGRMDIHIEFKLASKYQAQELFRCFYLPDSEIVEVPKTDEDSDSGYSSASDEKNEKVLDSPTAVETPTVKDVKLSGNSHRQRGPQLSRGKVEALAAKFADAIPDREHSMASLQGYLMAYKIRPHEAVEDAVSWSEKERAEIVARKEKAASSDVKGKDT